MNVVDEFQKFQRARLKKAKKSDIEDMKIIYADTELFDITYRRMIKDNYNYYIRISMMDKFELPYSQFLLPFESCFIKVLNHMNMDNTVKINSTIFIREYSYDKLTGCITFEYSPINSIISFEYLLVDVPFTIKIGEKVICSFDLEIINKVLSEISKIFQLQRDKCTSYKNYSSYEIDIEFKKEYESYCSNCLNGIILSIIKVQEIFISLSKSVILTDHSNAIEHYHFKNKPTKKITNRPIYYVLDKEKYQKKNYNIKPITKLEYSYAFKVIGHWRKIKGIGKDRKGNYHVDGFTWVNEYLKGEGELVKRIRVVK